MQVSLGCIGRGPAISAGLAVAAVFFNAFGSDKVMDDSRLIGAERCGSCHKDQYEAWKKSPHFMAYDALDEHERHDARCFGCHSTGLEEGHRGVQCESCHGPGRYYAKRMVMRDSELRKMVGLEKPDSKTCARCHTEDAPNMVKFEPEVKKKLIVHWRNESEEGKPSGTAGRPD